MRESLEQLENNLKSPTYGKVFGKMKNPIWSVRMKACHDLLSSAQRGDDTTTVAMVLRVGILAPLLNLQGTDANMHVNSS